MLLIFRNILRSNEFPRPSRFRLKRRNSVPKVDNSIFNVSLYRHCHFRFLLIIINRCRLEANDQVLHKMTDLNKILTTLETYKGRDRFLRLLCYSTKCAAGLIKSEETALKLDRFSRELSTSRACFRLLDDVPALVEVIHNCAQKKNESQFDKILFAIECVVDVLFSPIDHISWAIDHKILSWHGTPWDTASTVCWVISLYINLYKTVMKLSDLSRQKLESSHLKGRDSKGQLAAKQWHLEMSALKCLLDLSFAVSYLPRGVLWAQQLDKWQVGALGSLSSAISLYQTLFL